VKQELDDRLVRIGFGIVQRRVAVAVFPGIDGMNFKIFSPKKLAKKLAFFAQNSDKFFRILIIPLVFKKTPIFTRQIGENRRK
jgi:hypothetical protein